MTTIDTRDLESARLFSDRMSIIDVITRYAVGIDLRRWEDFGTCFTDEFDADFLVTNGWVRFQRDEFVELCQGIFAHYDATQHISANHQVTISGDVASCVATLNATHFLANADGGDTQQQVGYYEFHLVRGDDWRINRVRQIVSWQTGNQDLFDRTGADVNDTGRLSRIEQPS